MSPTTSQSLSEHRRPAGGGGGGGGGTPAAYPSVITASGQKLVDSNSVALPMMKGFNAQATAAWSAQSFIDMYNKGCTLIRTVIFWDSFETSKGVIASAAQTQLDNHVARLVAAAPSGDKAAGKGIYTTFCIYYGPAQHWPGWYTTNNGWPTSGGSNMGVLTAQNAGVYAGQFFVQWLANRYGNPASAQYSPAVIGLGVNEPAPDSSSNGYLATHLNEQATMTDWFRTSAPNWMTVLSCGYGGGVPLPNATGSGQTSQTFTPAPTDPTLGRGNAIWDLHGYFECTPDAATKIWDGRNQYGMPNGSNQIQPNQTAHLTYPPSGITRAQCQAEMTAYFAAHKEYCDAAHSNMPFMLGEWGWVPKNGTSTWTGGDLYAADMIAAAKAAGVLGWIEWDYNTNQSSSPWCVRPGIGAVGADTDGWQTATNIALAT